MTNLRMGDGPVANLPAGLDAYAGYVDDGGDGITYPGVVAKFPQALHLSISVHGAPARVGDVEEGALNSWQHYEIGYTAVSNVGAQILRDGRPKVLWVAHYTDIPHICTSATCWPSSPVPWAADGTQWTTHNNTWDESLIDGDAFFPPPPSPIPIPKGRTMKEVIHTPTTEYLILDDETPVALGDPADGSVLTDPGGPWKLPYNGPLSDALMANWKAAKP